MKTKTIAIALLMTGLLAMSCKKRDDKPEEIVITPTLTEITKSKIFGKTMISLIGSSINSSNNVVVRDIMQSVDSFFVSSNGEYKLIKTSYVIAAGDTLVDPFKGKNYPLQISADKIKSAGTITISNDTLTISSIGVFKLTNDPSGNSFNYNTNLKQDYALVNVTYYNGFKTTHIKSLALR